MTKRSPTLEQRFWSKVDRSGGPDACWPWLACRNQAGYGMFAIKLEGRTVISHRLAYELIRGPIPTGLHLDHVCHTNDESCPPGPCAHRGCVNPNHLEPVTAEENARRAKVDAGEANRTKTHCPAGHEYTEANTRYLNDRSGVHRRCRECSRQQKRRAQARRTAAT